MKLTLEISDPIMQSLEREAIRQGKTIDELAEIALRILLEERQRTELPDLPRFNGGGALVDIADREALYDAMEG